MRRPANNQGSDEASGMPQGSKNTPPRVTRAQLTEAQYEQVLRLEDLIHHEVNLLAPEVKGAAREDLVQRGFVGAMLAVLRFDPSRGHKLSTFAWPRIRGAILDGMKDPGRQPRFVGSSREATTRYMDELPDRFEVGFDPVDIYEAELDDVVGDFFAAKAFGMASQAPSPEDALSERESHANVVKVIQEALKQMPKEERAVVPLLCVQEPRAEQVMRERLVKELNVTVRSIHRYVTRARKKLREVLEGHGITYASPLRDREYACGDERPKIEELEDL